MRKQNGPRIIRPQPEFMPFYVMVTYNYPASDMFPAGARYKVYCLNVKEGWEVAARPHIATCELFDAKTGESLGSLKPEA